MDDPLLRQLANRWAESEPVHQLGDALALYHLWGGPPELVIVGDPDDAVELVRALRPPRVVSLPRRAAERLVAEDGYAAHEGWAYRWTDAEPLLPADGVGWLTDDDDAEVSEVLTRGFPDASMPVGHPDVRRWAGLRRDGRLVAVAADATQAEGLGFLASIATDPAARGTGAGTAVTAWSTRELVREHGRCGLWHMEGNVVAAALYTRLGYRDEHPMGVVVQERAPGR